MPIVRNWPLVRAIRLSLGSPVFVLKRCSCRRDVPCRLRAQALTVVIAALPGLTSCANGPGSPLESKATAAAIEDGQCASGNRAYFGGTRLHPALSALISGQVVVMRSPGLRIAVRVAGSWIAAAGLLSLGLWAKG